MEKFYEFDVAQSYVHVAPERANQRRSFVLILQKSS